MNTPIDPNHNSSQGLLRTIGPAMAVIGGGCIAIAMLDFFSSFGTFGGPPKYFWLFFVGGPIFAMGIGITKFAYLGAITRYVAGEVAPVQRDTFNYMAGGIQPGVQGLARAVSAGIKEGMSETPEAAVKQFCPACGGTVQTTDRFCRHCGGGLQPQG